MLLLSIGLIISGAVAFSDYSNIQPFKQLNRFFADSCQLLTGATMQASTTIVVDVDEDSLNAIGQWPWPRYRIAELVQSLANMQPAAIGIDILFAEEDRTALSNVQQRIKQDFNLDIDFSNIPRSLVDNDGYLGSVLAKTGAVGAAYFYFDHDSGEDMASEPPFQITGETALLDLNKATGLLGNTYKIASQLKYTGFINSQPDDDGNLRQLPLLIRYKGAIYPHLALAAYMRALGTSTAIIEGGRYGPVIHIGGHRIAISKQGFARLRFNGNSRHYPSVPAIDILNDKADATRFKGKTVFIGSSAAGIMDLHHTVFDAQFPGVKALAAAVEGFAADNTLIVPVWAPMLEAMLTLLVGLGITLLFLCMRNMLLVPVCVAAIALLMLTGSVAAFVATGMIISPAAPISTLMLLFILLFMIRFGVEKRQSYLWFQQLSQTRQALLETLDVNVIASTLATSARQLLGCQSAAVIYLSHGEARYASSGSNAFGGDFLPEKMLDMKCPQLSNHTSQDGCLLTGIHAFEKFIHMPILDKHGVVLGSFELFDRSSSADFRAEDLELVESLSGIASAALLNASLLAEQQANKREISEAAERLNCILDANFDAVIAHQDFEVVYTNKAAQHLFGYHSLEDTLGKNPLNSLPAPFRKKAQRDMKAAIRKNISFGALEMEGLRAESEEHFPIEIANTPIRWNNKPVIVSIVRDITKRKAREEELRLLESAVASITEGVLITDACGAIIYVNPSFLHHSGYVAKQVIGQTAAILDSLEQSRQFSEQFQEIINDPRVWSGRMQNRNMDGSLFPAHISIAPIFTAQKTVSHFVIVQDDLSEDELLHEKMAQTQKMEAIGTLVGGLAHDFNNMLGTIAANLFLLNTGVEYDDKSKERIAGMENTVFHASKMIRQMLDFAHEDGTEMHAMDLKGFLKETYKLSKAALPSDISYQLQYPPNDNIWIVGDTTRIQQVILNLVANARHAVQHVKQPEITLLLDRQSPPEQLLQQNPESGHHECWCRICCIDNGYGMSADTLEHIFEPFFTTKARGEGTGLGMVMVFDTVQAHLGLIDIDSNPNEGTSISIWLPQQHETSVLTTTNEVLTINGHGKVILIVDDEESIRVVLQEVFTQCGFSVLTAIDGEQAVDLFRNSAVDLVLMDVVMPNKGGVEAAMDIRQLNADIPIIFQTGHGEAILLDAVEAINHSDALRKPVQIPELLKHVNRMVT